MDELPKYMSGNRVRVVPHDGSGCHFGLKIGQEGTVRRVTISHGGSGPVVYYVEVEQPPQVLAQEKCLEVLPG